MTSSHNRRRRILIALMSTIAVTAIVVPTAGVLLTPTADREGDSSVPTTTAAPELTIPPLAVRPVVSAFVTTPEQCPAPASAPPDQPTRICDIEKTAVYELGPEALRLQLVNVDNFRNPLTGAEVVQMSMTNDSAQQFEKFTAERVGEQVAFVRTGTVVWGPKITTPINGTVLQLSGELSPEQAAEVATLLRDGN